ncbi:MAG TPA: hypothetical protein VLM40_03845, partial [Gemmata sp.]|nr:hypothetical protein [Gemmata sp.]
EGQAAIELESLAFDVPNAGSYAFEILVDHAESLVVDTRPLIAEVWRDAGRGCDEKVVARRFHSTLVEVIAAVCTRLRAKTSLETVVLSGGVFLNALLSSEVAARLSADGFKVYRHRLVPPNDGGLALGQAAIAAALQR